MKWAVLVSLSISLPFCCPYDIQASEKNSTSIESISPKDLILRINHIPLNKPMADEAIQIYEALARAEEKCLLTDAQRKQLKITKLPKEILDRQDNTTAFYLFLMVSNGHRGFLNPLKILSQSNLLSKYYLGNLYYQGCGIEKNIHEAVTYYRLAADQGLAQAQFRIGYCYGKGQGVEKDPKEAVKWYRLAAKQGFASAQNNLSCCYNHGDGVEKNFQKSIKWLTLAANQGDGVAQVNLGQCYYSGQGVKKNLKETFKWYLLAANQGLSHAQTNVGYSYQYGEGVGKDLKEGIKWYELAANKGFAPAQSNLGYCYGKGQGVEKDPKEAVKWLALAANQGNVIAQRELKKLIIYTESASQEKSLSPDTTKAIDSLQETLEKLLSDLLSWKEWSKNASLGRGLTSVLLKAKFTSVDNFYRSMISLLPLLKNPDFAITCIEIKDKELEKYVDTYQDRDVRYFSFDTSYTTFKKNYEENRRAAILDIEKMSLWGEKISSLLSAPDNIGANLKQLDTKENQELFQFISPIFNSYLNVSTPLKRHQALIDIKVFADAFLKSVTFHRESLFEEEKGIKKSSGNLIENLLTFLASSMQQSTPPLRFKETFETLIGQAAPYRNYLLFEKNKVYIKSCQAPLAREKGKK